MRQKFIIIMGVSGSGKTAVGTALSKQLGCRFLEGDAYHPSANVEKMRTGIPLDDSDRAPWLKALNAALLAAARDGVSTVLACSALKRSYRGMIAEGLEDVHFVFLDGSESLLRARMEKRSGHFMAPAMLQSQLASLERPESGEALSIDIDRPLSEIVDRIIAWLENTDNCGTD